ncbi:MAG: hypothetical protein QXR45_12435 [Candidatus Bathyarchaeia archaeon]
MQFSCFVLYGIWLAAVGWASTQTALHCGNASPNSSTTLTLGFSTFK